MSLYLNSKLDHLVRKVIDKGGSNYAGSDLRQKRTEKGERFAKR